MDKVVNTTMKREEDLDDYLMEKTLARAELEKMGTHPTEKLRTSVYKDLLRCTGTSR